MQEKWTRWEPISNLSKKYYMDSNIETADDGLKVTLINQDGKKVLIFFSGYVISFRSTFDSFVYDTLDYLEKNYGGEFYTEWTFFKIENSEYLKWIEKQSGGIFEQYEPQHFCIFGIDRMIDIIFSGEPEVSHIK